MPLAPTTSLEGVARCSRYAFGPNKLRMCGPDANAELGAYLATHTSDQGLTRLLEQFKTMYPYLQAIAQANRIADPFDNRVVEAYWIGNELLETISQPAFYRHLAEALELKRKIPLKSFDELAGKLPLGARMHHSFHVLNVYRRTGNLEILHTLESMDACRISWGRITEVAGPTIQLHRRPLELTGHQLALGEEQNFSVSRRLEDDLGDELAPGNWLTLHWGVPCEVISERSVAFLEHYTRLHLKLANRTL